MTSPLESGATPDLAAALADLPARVRVHDLARRAGLNSKQAIAALSNRGVDVVSASSSVDREVAESLLTALLGGTPAGTTPEPGTGLEPSGAASGEPSGAPEGASDEEAGRSRRRGRRGRGRGQSDRAEALTVGSTPDGDDGGTAAESARAEGEPADGAAASADEGEAAESRKPDGGDGERSGRRRRRGGRGRRGPGKGEPSGDGDAGDSVTGGDGADGGDHVEESAARADGGAEHPDAEHADAEHPDADHADADHADAAEDDQDSERSGSRRRRRRRRRGGSSDAGSGDDPTDTVVHVREGRASGSDVQGVKGSTRLEAKRQRRRDSRDSRRRPQILSEAEFLARRESVDRVMAVRQRGDLAQVALLEDGVLVEHFVSRSGSASMIGGVYLARVQNVLPSMEAAFMDIGRGRNAVLYAGEVNWDIAGLQGKERRIEQALSSGDTVLVQVSKDPIGHKGARLTTQISLPGRFLVYVPGGGATGISRKLPDTERKRLKAILDRIVPSDAGVIIRTAAEGVGEEELAADVARLQAKWEEISAAAGGAGGSTKKTASAPTQLYAEPDTLIKVVRDLFNSDINRLLIDGDEAWESVSQYVLSMAPELAERVSRYVGDRDVFAAYRIDEQITKALQRKVHLPSGGSLVIDRTEAMTVIDVNTGKFTGSGGNLEETVTRNNLEAAEEIVRQLRLRDIGGIIVVDFIDMVLESNRELVLRRLTECLGRDRTRHQVAEVTSLGLVQMTRKRMGLGLVEAFSTPCTHCAGRGIVLHDTPADTGAGELDGGDGSERGRRKGRKRGRGRDDHDEASFEPLVVERVAAGSKPNPLGPKAPALFRAAGHADGQPEGTDAATVPAADVAIAGAAVADSTAGETPADIRATEIPATESTVTEPASAGSPIAESQVAEPPLVEPPAVEPPAAKPARRRHAASRPAGAPAVAATAVDMTVPLSTAAATATDGSVPVGAAADGAAAGGAAAKATVADGAAAEGAAVDGAAAGVPARPRRRRSATRPAGPVDTAAPVA